MLKDQQNSIITSAQTLVIAGAHESVNFEQTNFLSVNQLRGQVTHIPTNAKSESLKTVICGKGYIAPSTKGIISCGASYNKGLLSTQLTRRGSCGQSGYAQQN